MFSDVGVWMTWLVIRHLLAWDEWEKYLHFLCSLRGHETYGWSVEAPSFLSKVWVPFVYILLLYLFLMGLLSLARRVLSSDQASRILGAIHNCWSHSSCSNPSNSKSIYARCLGGGGAVSPYSRNCSHLLYILLKLQLFYNLYFILWQSSLKIENLLFKMHGTFQFLFESTSMIISLYNLFFVF